MFESREENGNLSVAFKTAMSYLLWELERFLRYIRNTWTQLCLYRLMEGRNLLQSSNCCPLLLTVIQRNRKVLQGGNINCRWHQHHGAKEWIERTWERMWKGYTHGTMSKREINRGNLPMTAISSLKRTRESMQKENGRYALQASVLNPSRPMRTLLTLQVLHFSSSIITLIVIIIQK